mgnify:CR=1 FL=1
MKHLIGLMTPNNINLFFFGTQKNDFFPKKTKPRLSLPLNALKHRNQRAILSFEFLEIIMKSCVF